MKKPGNISDLDWKLLKKKYKNLEPVIEKINDNYPVQYLIGNVDFYGNIIKVNSNVLIPRFETESLVDESIKLIKKLGLEQSSMLEVGTGSGCISISIKKEIPTIEITAIDISRKALWLARSNAKLNNVKINFICKNLFKFNLVNNYDVILSNPPYIENGDDVSVETKYEPHNAIYVDDKDPLLFYKEILKVSKQVVNKKHLIGFEINESYGKEMVNLCKEYYPNDKIELIKDLAGLDRFVFVYTID